MWRSDGEINIKTGEQRDHVWLLSRRGRIFFVNGIV